MTTSIYEENKRVYAVIKAVARNAKLLDALSWIGRHDYLSFIDMTMPEYHSPTRHEIDITVPALMARYLAGRNRGRWQYLELNRRRRDNGFRVSRVTHHRIPDEDIITMQNIVLLQARQHPNAAAARDKFAEATRTAAFSLQLGIREIRLMARQPWADAHWLASGELSAMQRLIDKGLLVHTQGENPRLSEAGELLRQLLVLSRHIVEPTAP